MLYSAEDATSISTVADHYLLWKRATEEIGLINKEIEQVSSHAKAAAGVIQTAIEASDDLLHKSNLNRLVPLYDNAVMLVRNCGCGYTPRKNSV